MPWPSSAAGRTTDLPAARARIGLASRGNCSGSAPGRGRPVAHFMDRTPEAIAAILGILKAGAAYVPIDPDYPESRHRFIVRDSGYRHRVSPRPRSSRGSPASSGTRCLPMVRDRRRTKTFTLARIDRCATNGLCDLHVRIHGRSQGRGRVTTGTSSTPQRRESATTANAPARFLLIPSFSFDSSVAVIFWTLAQGSHARPCRRRGPAGSRQARVR